MKLGELVRPRGRVVGPEHLEGAHLLLDALEGEGAELAQLVLHVPQHLRAVSNTKGSICDSCVYTPVN